MILRCTSKTRCWRCWLRPALPSPRHSEVGMWLSKS
nr:MAG TPA: hypothetical protein [Caudoviricetes sp.]